MEFIPGIPGRGKGIPAFPRWDLSREILEVGKDFQFSRVGFIPGIPGSVERILAFPGFSRCFLLPGEFGNLGNLGNFLLPGDLQGFWE